MKTPFFLRPLLALATLGLAACAPQALYFHESTKVGFSASYTASDSEPLSTSFGYKRRIVAVVPGKERHSPTGQKDDAENVDEALSTISKFYVKGGTRDGLIIRNNFATGMAARKLLKDPTAAVVTVGGLMHGTPVVTDSTGAVVNADGVPITSGGDATVTVTDVAAARVARIRSKMIGGSKPKPHPKEIDQPISKELFIRDGQTWVRETLPDGTVTEHPLKKSGGNKPDSGHTKKPDPVPDPAGPVPDDGTGGVADAELFVDPATGKTMKRITKPDGSTEVVPLKR